jgi:dolichol-phosphate mannosyltransferase
MARKDLMIGSRYVPGGGTENWPKSREVISRSINVLVRLLFRTGVKDASGGYRCYRVATLRKARLDRMVSRGYSFQQEMLYRNLLAGARVGETPIVFANRRAGKSKVNLKETVRSLGTILYLGARAITGIERRASRRA